MAVAPHNAADLPKGQTVRDDVRIPLAAPEPIDHFIQAERIRRGDTLSSLLNRLGALDGDFQRFVTTNTVARKVLQMRTGRTVLAELDASGLVYRFSYRVSGLEADESRPAVNGRRVLIERLADRFVAREEDAPLERQTASRYVELRTTLGSAAAAGDMPDAITAQLGDVFSSSLDVGKDLRPGDTIRVVYETLREAGSFDVPVAGRILAAEIIAGSVRHQAMWFEPTRKTGRLAGRGASRGKYFDFEGGSMKKSFLRNPLEDSRVMSGFTEARMHPILRDWRAHKGVDFAAPTGTRVRSTGDGTIEFVGQQRGYGNVVIVKHSSQITTLYAHLSGFTDDMTPGAHVNQGDVVGFVGQTGWATGPHLHYEFRINEEQADPLTVALPDAEPPLDQQDRQRFLTVSSTLKAEIKRFGELQLARFQ